MSVVAAPSTSQKTLQNPFLKNLTENEYDPLNDTQQQSQKTLIKIQKQEQKLFKEFYKKAKKSLIIENTTMALASRYEAYMNIIRDSDIKIKALGFWQCNIVNQKLFDIITLASEQHREELQSLEISDNAQTLKKNTAKAIGEMFLNLDTKSTKVSLFLQRSSISPQSMQLLMNLLALSKIRQFTLNQMGLNENHLKNFSSLMAGNKKIDFISMQHNDLRMDGCLYISQGLVYAKSLKSLNLNGNRIGTKGLKLLCESLKDNNKLESLFLNDNFIDDDISFTLVKLLSNQRNVIKELHLAFNNFSQLGLIAIFDCLAFNNKRLKYLDVAYNVIEIGIMKSLRTMIEKNSSLQYLSISDLYKFNRNAINTLVECLALNKSLKLVDLKKCTKSFYTKIIQEVNMCRGDKPIIFLKDDGYIRTRGAIDKIFNDEDGEEIKSNSKKYRSYTPQKALEESKMRQNQIQIQRPKTGDLPKRRIMQREASVEMDQDDMININTQLDYQPSVVRSARSARSLEYSDMNSPGDSSFNYTFQKNSQRESIASSKKKYVPLRSPSREELAQHYQNIQNVQNQNPSHFSSLNSNNFQSITDDRRRFSNNSMDDPNLTSSKSPKRVQFANDIKIFKDKERQKQLQEQNEKLALESKQKQQSKAKLKQNINGKQQQPKSNELQESQVSLESFGAQSQTKKKKIQPLRQRSSSSKKNKQNSSKYSNKNSTLKQSATIDSNMTSSILSNTLNNSQKKGILKGKLSEINASKHEESQLHPSSGLSSAGLNKQLSYNQTNHVNPSTLSQYSPSQYTSLESNSYFSSQYQQTHNNQQRQNLLLQKSTLDRIPSQRSTLQNNQSISYNNNNNNTINQSMATSHMDDSTSFALSPEEKENLKYNMKNDKVVVFYKKILGEIRDVIREERSNIKKYLN
ncbi:UNKNOWN [Stylonychia lemnae]|uniref:Leucine Rich Repeat family protein n=1 Tax=Stylonychia lemnae TaxID=5949 RepID=A0A078AX32_STYLE|nr:UNKNOWN [Stylonychia lemnae]|eukprot:CDW86621.1 UNKNOWN [Stylonychia lemnae]